MVDSWKFDSVSLHPVAGEVRYLKRGVPGVLGKGREREAWIQNGSEER